MEYLILALLGTFAIVFLIAALTRKPMTEERRLAIKAEQFASVHAEQVLATQDTARRRQRRRNFATGYLAVSHPELLALSILLDKNKDDEARRE